MAPLTREIMRAASGLQKTICPSEECNYADLCKSHANSPNPKMCTEESSAELRLVSLKPFGGAEHQPRCTQKVNYGGRMLFPLLILEIMRLGRQQLRCWTSSETLPSCLSHRGFSKARVAGPVRLEPQGDGAEVLRGERCWVRLLSKVRRCPA